VVRIGRNTRPSAMQYAAEPVLINRSSPSESRNSCLELLLSKMCADIIFIYSQRLDVSTKILFLFIIFCLHVTCQIIKTSATTRILLLCSIFRYHATLSVHFSLLVLFGQELAVETISTHMYISRTLCAL
jgi:hypothetical protein